jgi:hypothetical protein
MSSLDIKIIHPLYSCSIRFAYEHISASSYQLGVTCYLPYVCAATNDTYPNNGMSSSTNTKNSLLLFQFSNDARSVETGEKKIQFLPYGRSIGSWICLTHKTYTCYTVQNTIRYDIRFTGMKVRYTIFERVTMYNNAKRTIRKLQRFISSVIML